jgi:hypothetical protein
MHKTIKLLLLLPLCIFSYEMHAQNYYLGYKHGYSWNEVNSNGNIKGMLQNNFCTGLTFELITKKKLRLGVEILYEKRGFNLGYTVFFNNLDERFLINYHHQNYLSIPIKIGYQFGNKIYGFADIGVVPAFNLTSTFKYPDTDNSFNIIGEITEDEELKIRPFDLAALYDIGVGYNVSHKISILSSLRLQKSLYEFSKDYQMSHRATTLFLTLKYKL